MISIKAHINNVALHHTIFDLPFAFMGAVLAANGHPRLIDLFWVAMAITTGRAAAMAIDNLADLKYDKQQPRMAYRAMVAGRISKREALAFIVICLMLMVLSVLQLQPICIYLLPVAAIPFIIYPFMKRITYWPQVVLGLAFSWGALMGWPAVFGRIFSEAFGLRQAVGGGFGAVVMNGIKRGLFSNEAGSGSAPCAAAAAECDDPVKMGLVQALGVLIDTIVICSCTAFVMLLAPESVTSGLQGMNLLQAAMQYHLGSFGVVFIAVTLALFSFSTFIGILFYARSNVAYLFGDRWGWQTAYKVLALVMLMVGGLEAYTVVWDLGDVGIGLMTIFNLIALYPMSGEAIAALRDYERRKHLTQN